MRLTATYLTDARIEGKGTIRTTATGTLTGTLALSDGQGGGHAVLTGDASWWRNLAARAAAMADEIESLQA